MDLLILGGTQFVGRHLAETALARGHDLTLFNRGRSAPDLFPDARHLVGDRDGDLAALKDGRWDAVIDTCGYVPRIVRESAELLADRVERYVFISTGSVYPDDGEPGSPEDSLLATIEDPTTEQVDNDTYGPLKVLCEQAAEAAFPARTLIPRPGIIAGPHDPTDRFTYWVRRGSQGGEIAAPGRPDQPVQVIDARDLATFIVAGIESGLTGPYNLVGPGEPLTMGSMIAACAAPGAEVTWIPDEIAREAKVHFPLALPAKLGLDHVFEVDCGKAKAAGLSHRPIEQTIADTLAWDSTRPQEPMRGAPTPEQEQSLIGVAREAGQQT
jgi:2'-hydroxyisoflavone reductase